VTQLDRKQSIPTISPQRERLLEYDLVRAIARVGSAERPKVGLMAGLPVLGERFNPFTRQSSEPWVLANELKREFEVKEVPLTRRDRQGPERSPSSTRATFSPRPNTRSTNSSCAAAADRVVGPTPTDQMPTMPGMPQMPRARTRSALQAWA
jgi:hypothetical protein